MIRPHWRPAYVGIGSNLDSPMDQVAAAIQSLQDVPDTLLVCQSGLYRSAPMGSAGQPDYINAVAGLLTQKDPRELLRELQKIEREHGRTRDGEHWGPRTLDLDLLAYAGQIVDDKDLTVPHPGIAARNFVLFPWQEIAPGFRLPGGADIAGMASRVSRTEPRIERIE